jgi:large subunit ribosomal protein L7A
MLSELKNGFKVAGVKQVRRAIADGSAVKVFLAKDADPRVVSPVLELCGEKSVPVETAGTMAELGAVCGIAVGSAAAAIVKRF